jgi:hypothetical protein
MKSDLFLTALVLVGSFVTGYAIGTAIGYFIFGG